MRGNTFQIASNHAELSEIYGNACRNTLKLR